MTVWRGNEPLITTIASVFLPLYNLSTQNLIKRSLWLCIERLFARSLLCSSYRRCNRRCNQSFRRQVLGCDSKPFFDIFTYERFSSIQRLNIWSQYCNGQTFSQQSNGATNFNVSMDGYYSSTTNYNIFWLS